MNLFRILILFAFSCLSLPALAAAPQASSGQASSGQASSETTGAEHTSSPDSAIAQSQAAGDDPRIAGRIEGIFDELSGLETVKVEVNKGVVTLSGTLADADAITRAENIAARVAGVVTVENAIERDLSVERNLSIIGPASSSVHGLVAALPLLGVALLVALAIAAVGYTIAGFGALWDRISPNAFLADLIRSAIRFVAVVGGIVVALDIIGAGALLGAVLGGAGVVGIALGFAMRDTIENYVASVMLSVRQPFRPNDHVLIDDLEGRVIRLTSRATVLMTLEGNHLRIPNSKVFKAVILNYTRNPQRRFDFELGIDADDDPRAAIRLGIGVLCELSFVLGDPAPAGRISKVGDSNIVLLFLGWIDQREADWFKSRSVAIAEVKDALEQGGFVLPEPIYRLRFDGRTDPLPIGRPASAKEQTPVPERAERKPSLAADNDVRPESEIRDMVETERSSDTEQAADLLDDARPVE